MSISLLVVDDDPALCSFVADGLSRAGQITVRTCTSAEQALDVLTAGAIDVALVDINMPRINGLELCRRIQDARPETLVVVISAFGSLETAIEAIRAGAYDFVVKPFDVEQIELAVERARQLRELREEVRRLRQVVASAQPFEDILGESPAVHRMCALVESVAGGDSTVLVCGESGSGKELVARALHTRGNRAQGPFVALNCAAMTDSLLESELFGHARGAFTDAKDARTGLMVKAKGGTLFLDELGEMPPGMQAKLLRALETRTVRPVGSDVEVAFDARIVAATNRDLETEVEEGRFRRDLFFRINVIRIDVPPLRARGSDVLLLAEHFVIKLARRLNKPVSGISTQAAERLMSYPWPGNIRELQNAIERAVALTQFDKIVVEDLPDSVRTHRRLPVLPAGDDPAELLPMHEVEKRYILRVLESAGGNKTLAAQILGFDRRTMYRKLERYMGGKSSGSP